MPDPAQLARLITERAPGLTLYARQWLDAPSAEDALQEALASLLAQSPPPDDPVAWTCRTIRNAAIDQVRSAARRRQRERRVAETRPEWFDATPDSLIDARTAEAALRHLPDLSREIVVLRIWADLGFSQIAQTLNLSVSTVHNRYTAALEQLRTRLENPCKTNPPT
jgi:RNA polymerase sigma-70 factor (ECF subfamily)